MNSEKDPQNVGTLLSEVEPESVEWLWPGRIPKGKVSLIEGDPGTGKSALTIDLAARVSVGKELPDETPCQVAGVVLLSAEDGPADTIRPRLDAAGADPSKVLALTTLCDVENQERMLSVPDDVPLIERGIERVGAGLVVIDPLVAFLPKNVDANKDQDVRRALAPLAVLAERTGAAVVVVRHLNKGTGGKALYRGGGSIGIIGAARSALLVAKDPQDEDRRVLAAQKSNLSKPAPSLSFSLEDAANGAARVVWGGESPLDASQLLAAPPDGEVRTAETEAKNFLRELLADGPVPVEEVFEEARSARIAEKTLRRAKTTLGVVSEREGKPGKRGGGRWLWALPGIKVAKPDGWPSKPVEASDYPMESAYASQELAPHLGGQHVDVQSLDGHLNGRVDSGTDEDTASEVVGALQHLFDHNPEARKHGPDRLAMELYYSDYLDQEPSPETVTAAMKTLDRMSSRA